MEEEVNKLVSFCRIDYKGVNSINYISDFLQLNPAHLSYLNSLSAAPVTSDRKEMTKFDTIASDLYKRIVKQGYVQRPSAVSKRSKRTDADVNYYNTNDDFIDDEEIIQKKDILTQFQDYACVPVTSIEDLYNSAIYHNKAEEVVSESLKRKQPDQFNPHNIDELEKFDEVKKKIRNNIKEFILKKNSPHPHLIELDPEPRPAEPLILPQEAPVSVPTTVNALAESPVCPQ